MFAESSHGFATLLSVNPSGVCRKVGSMKISDVICSSCGAAYEMAEAVSVQGKPGEVRCALCGNLLARWDESRLRAFRLIMAVEHRYASVPVPPAPGFSP
jgi:ribosomal protein L32